MFPVEYSREKFLDGELITYTLLDVTDDSHWRQVTDEIIREPLAPIQYWINDNRNSFGNASIDTLRDVNRKLQEAGVEQLFYAMITEDRAYVPSNIVVNELAAAEGYPVTAKLVGNKEAALRWFKELHGENHACQHHDSAPVGVLAIDFGSRTTLPGLERFSYCLRCHGPVQVRPAWRA